MQKLFFSVVTAAYNVGPWIKDLLNSLEIQSLDFIANIHLIVVDDGSTDETAEIVQHWVDRFPQNITLLRQENSGPATARNCGMKMATGEWVTFIDADDFVAPSYFQVVKDFLIQSQYDGPIVVGNTLLYYESHKQAVNGHPLSYKFNQTQITELLKEPTHIQLFANTCFFRKELIDRFGLSFDDRIKPTFEDAHFVNSFLLHSKDFRLAFIKEAHYFYRRRGTGAGLVEGGWAKPTKYCDQIIFGYLGLMRQYQQVLGFIPEFIQNIIIYECHWYLQQILENALPYNFLSGEKEKFIDLLKYLFKGIHEHQIILSKIPVLELRTRIAMLKAFKGFKFTNSPFILKEFDKNSCEAHLQHYSTDTVSYSLCNNHGNVPTSWEKHITHRFDSTILCHEYRFWAPLNDHDTIWPEVDGEKVGVLSRNQLLETLKGSEVIEDFFLPKTYLTEQQQRWLALGSSSEALKFSGCWILMDRVQKADDNAEHFCRWLLANHPKQPVYYVLDCRSKDWERLAREGFPLLAYRSQDHLSALNHAKWLISSHVDVPVIDPFGTRSLFGVPTHKVAFLQHGITKEDISAWLNGISLDCMVTCSHLEFESILKERYKFTQRELVLSGFPRHDTLLRKSNKQKSSRTILICPTWREYLRLAPQYKKSITAESLEKFQKSDFFQKWNEITGSQTLARLARDSKFKIFFLPHPEIEPFLSLFENSDVVTFLKWATLKSFQDLLVSCSLAITDYSSLQFDLAYIEKPIAYYQFNETPHYLASQRRSMSYFRYEEHGFGPILQTREDVENWIRDTLSQGCVLQEPYKSRADAFFTLRDGQNCKRVYDAILDRS
jgi:glycosyltransferase involved in cell wall biosynthesis